MEYELYHYGVKGMKWGVRKKEPVSTEAYKSAKKEYKQARKELRKSGGFMGTKTMGINNIRRINKIGEKVNKAEMKVVSEKAKLKAAKSAKAERRYYTREMNKAGLPGSAKDAQMGNRSTRLYDQIVKDKGKKYAESVVKKSQNQLVSGLVAGVAVTVGIAVVNAMLENN